jgi:uncharacterized damage-inducible protein DinB
MRLNDLILNEFQQEIANTRKILERIPEDKWDWKPHPKSWKMGELATHIANVPSWTMPTINSDFLDIAPPGSEPPKTTAAKSLAEVLERFEQNCREAQEVLSNTSDAHFQKSWSMLMGGQKIFTMPRLTVLRNFVMNHHIHHRAQLGVYLRLNEVSVPGVYGPSADEGGM